MGTVKMEGMSEFRITYDGPALQSSEMDVNELAPALLAVGDLLYAATFLLSGGKATPKVKVKASFKTGSFGIDFTLATGIVEYVADLFSSKEASATANAATILGLVGLTAHRAHKGLLHVLKWLRGRAIKKVGLESDRAILYVDDEQLEVELQVLELLRDKEVRKSLANMLEPLRKTGIDTFYTGTGAEPETAIISSEIEWFTAPDDETELLLDEVTKRAFSIVSLAFKEDNKWRLNDGNTTISAIILDQDFLRKVDANQISFSKGDVLVCSVRVLQWQTQQGTKTEYQIEEVLDHKPAMNQIRLPGT